jgi:hypothetical protein
MVNKVGQKVWKISIANVRDITSYRKSGVKIEEFEILGISIYRLCLNDPWFTTLNPTPEKGARKDRSIYTYLDDVHTSIRANNSILGDGVFISLYSTKKPTKRTLQKMVANAAVKLDKEYGFLFGGAKDALYDLADNYKF